MYDIFDDLFEDDFAFESYNGYDDSTSIDTELAFEAAMSLDTEYSYDPAYEGIGDVMGNIGAAVKSGVRNIIRKIKEAFMKLGRWIKDRFAGVRALSNKGDSKTLAKTLRSLDEQVKRASKDQRGRIKEKVDRIKRAIMRALDSVRSTAEKLRTQFTNGIVIFEALQKIGKSFITAMRNRLLSGNNEDNTEDGSDLADKSNDLVRKFEQLDQTIVNLISDMNTEIQKSTEDAEGKGAKISIIIREITLDKIDVRPIHSASQIASRICDEGAATATELERRVNDGVGVYDIHKKGMKSISMREHRDDVYSDTKKGYEDLRLDNTSKASASILARNWGNFTTAVKKCSEYLDKIFVRVNTNFRQHGRTVDQVSGNAEKIGTYGINSTIRPDYEEHNTAIVSSAQH